MIANKWNPIEDLPANWSELASSELESLAPIWKEESQRLGTGGTLKEFNQRLRREWAIETGIIENLYSIDRGITQLLIEKGMEASLIPHGSTDKPPEEIVAILRDQEEGLEGLFDFIAQRRDLSNSYIKQLHQTFTRNQSTVTAVNGLGRTFETPLLHGEWKRLPNNPTRPNGDVHEYCPPEHVAAEMDRLIAMHREHVSKLVPPEVEAAWLHHRFAQIHPFQDGNGRIARTLASLIFLRAEWFPLVIDRDIRREYLDALENADAGDLAPLTKLFTDVEKRSFLGALNISDEVLRDRVPIRQVISAAVERLQARYQAQLEKQRQVFVIADKLKTETYERFLQIKHDLDRELKGYASNCVVTTVASNEKSSFWFKKQIVELANQFNYFADTRTYGSWVRLKILEERQMEIIVSFHALGVEFIGLVAASAFLEFRDRDEDEVVTIDGPYRLNRELFQCSFNEREDAVRQRFQAWLNDVILSGLDQWRRQL